MRVTSTRAEAILTLCDRVQGGVHGEEQAPAGAAERAEDRN